MTNLQAFFNLTTVNGAYCYGDTSNYNYNFSVEYADGSNHIFSTNAWNPAGNYTQSSNLSGFTFGPNFAESTTVALASPQTPPAPSCGTATSVPNWMSTMIANFAPTNGSTYGYQIPSSTSRYDPLYPPFLCTVTNLPVGLVTPGCVTGSNRQGETLNNGSWQ